MVFPSTPLVSLQWFDLQLDESHRAFGRRRCVSPGSACHKYPRLDIFINNDFVWRTQRLVVFYQTDQHLSPLSHLTAITHPHTHYYNSRLHYNSQPKQHMVNIITRTTPEQEQRAEPCG